MEFLHSKEIHYPEGKAQGVVWSIYTGWLDTDYFADLPDVTPMMPIGSDFAITTARAVQSDYAPIESMCQERIAACQHAAVDAAVLIATEDIGPDYSQDELAAILGAEDTRVGRHLDEALWWAKRKDGATAVVNGVMTLIPEHLLPDLVPPF